jgi:ubiquinone/menaquinone biosynthesis C-methylase UbiE
MPRLDALLGEAAVLARLLRGMPRAHSHAEALARFYTAQSAHYDAFRERLLVGRAELVASIELPPQARIVELGGGTGRNAEFFAGRLAQIASYEVVDLCASLLARARERARRIPQMRAIEADATRWRPDGPVDVVILSYALTMIPDWRAAIDNAIAMLRPGGTLAVVDFHVSPAQADAGSVQHRAITRWFWPRWFAHDGVRLDPAHLALLRRRLPLHRVVESDAKVPWLPFARVPFYSFIGRVLAPASVSVVVPP